MLVQLCTPKPKALAEVTLKRALQWPEREGVAPVHREPVVREAECVNSAGKPHSLRETVRKIGLIRSLMWRGSYAELLSRDLAVTASGHLYRKRPMSVMQIATNFQSSSNKKATPSGPGLCLHSSSPTPPPAAAAPRLELPGGFGEQTEPKWVMRDPGWCPRGFVVFQLCSI